MTSHISDRTPARQNESIVSMAAMIAAVCIGEGSFVTMPFVVGAITERLDLSTGAAGMMISIQFAFMAITSGLLSVVIHKINSRLLVLGAATLIILAHGLAIVSSDVTWFVLSRACTGIGEGAALSIGYALAAATSRPHRAFSITTFGMAAAATPMYLSVPVVAEQAGSLAVFYVLFVMALICLPFLFGTYSGAGDANVENSDETLSIWWPFPWILVAIFFLYVSSNTLWAFSERIGNSIGLSIKLISSAFLATVLITLIGPIIANLSQKRWAYVRPITVGVVIHVLATFMLVYAMNAGMFFIGIILVNTMFMFFLPYFRGLTALMDPMGRLASATVISQTIATTVGPFLGGSILLAGGTYAHIGWMAAFFMTCSLLLILGAAKQAEKLFMEPLQGTTSLSR